MNEGARVNNAAVFGVPMQYLRADFEGGFHQCSSTARLCLAKILVQTLKSFIEVMEATFNDQFNFTVLGTFLTKYQSPRVLFVWVLLE
jgi:hypothetical protein